MEARSHRSASQPDRTIPGLLDIARDRVVQKRYNDSAGGGPDFDDLSPAFQASNIDAAAHADLKIDAIGYRRRPQLRGEQTPPLVLSDDQLADAAHTWNTTGGWLSA